MAAEQGFTTLDKDVADLIVGVLGGTGDQGRGLAHRLATAGNPVIIGSRSAERAQSAAAELGGGRIRGLANEDAAGEADVVIVAVPWEGHKDLLASLARALAGKIVIDCVNPLGFDKRGAYALPVPEGSAAQQAAEVLPDSWVVGGVPPRLRRRPAGPRGRRPSTSTSWCSGDDREATDLVQALAGRIPGVRGVYARAAAQLPARSRR